MIKRIIVLVVISCLVFGVVDLVIAQKVPKGWREYTIQKGDCLTKIALQVSGVNKSNVLWAAEEIAAVNGIQNPNFILAWTPIYIPESVEHLKKAKEISLVILKLKKCYPPLVFQRKPEIPSVLGRMEKKIEKISEKIDQGFISLEERFKEWEKLKAELKKKENQVKQLEDVLNEAGAKLKAQDEIIAKLQAKRDITAGLLILLLILVGILIIALRKIKKIKELLK